MAKGHKEWFRQADYDIGAAQIMFDGGRYIYAVFMCHLSIEKALKGHFLKKHGKQPPKTHNLMYLIRESEIEFTENMKEFIAKLNRESIVTRYPDDIRRISKNYNRKATVEIISKSKEALEWLRKNL
ncbi:MAG: HEPN domain-containing protein [bacterium]